MSLRRLWTRLRFRDAVALTAVPLLAVVLLVGASVRDYLAAIQFDDYWSQAASVSGSLGSRIRSVLDLPARVVIRQRLDPESRESAIIRLTVPGAAWDSIESDGQARWGHWVHGELRYGASNVPVRVRKRGDNSVHWLTEKRTLTVRTPRDDFYKRFRTFALSAKDPLTAYVANRMAQEFGLLAPSTELVPVYLNNRYYGMFRFLETVDESFLRPFDRMPGNIFRGDRAERGDFWKGVPRNVFENPALWDRVAVSDRWTGAGSGQLELLLRDLWGTGFDDHRRLMARLDGDEFARLFAYLFLVGDPYHMDRIHNQFLYEDPSTQELHPIPWDIRLLDLAHPERPFNDLFQAVLSDPFVVDRTVGEIVSRIRDGRAVAIGDSLVRSVTRRFPDELEYDRLRSGLIPDLGDADEAIALLHRNQALLTRWTDSSLFAVHVGSSAGTAIVDLESRGLVGADLTGLAIDGPAAPRVLRLDSNLNGRLDPADRSVALVRDSTGHYRPLAPIPLLSAWSTVEPGVRPGRLAYRLFLPGLSPAARVELDLRNRATGRPARQIDWPAGTPIATPTAWHPWRYPVAVGRTHRLFGSVHLTETLRIPEGDTLVVEPGTRVALGPDVSILSRGLVEIRGAPGREVRFVPADSSRPWGGLIFQGPGTDSSLVTDAEFTGGGGALIDRIEYTGMVNVHRAVGLRFERVVFRRNVRSDDTFHALHAQVTVRDSKFIQANSDAIDFDISSGLIEGNTIDGSGGDAIDLMTSTPRIVGNVITGSGDKGISIGEASQPFVFANEIRHCAIGIEAKDRSEPVILDNRLAGNRIGFRERRKNWRYGGGGWATIVNTVFADNATPRVRDSLSRVTVSDVIGLDSTLTATTTAQDLDWLYGRFGVAVDSVRPGRPSHWAFTAVRPALAEGRFHDDFGPVSDGWVATGGTTRLEKRRDALVMEVERVAGRAELPVGWDLTRSGGRLVIEVAGRDLAGGVLVARSDRGEVRQPFAAGGDLSTFRFVVVTLPPGRYRSVALEVTPRPGLSHIQRRTGLSVLDAGRLDLRSYAVYPLSPPALETARR